MLLCFVKLAPQECGVSPDLSLVLLVSHERDKDHILPLVKRGPQLHHQPFPFIQTILSAKESHLVSSTVRTVKVAGLFEELTAGRELHPAPETIYLVII